MEKILVIVFDNQGRAEAGYRALTELQAEGEILLYASALVRMDADGSVAVKDTSDSASRPLIATALVGALAGLVLGPMGAAAWAAGGVVMGALYEFVKRGGREEFLQEVGQHLQPGKA